MEEKDTEGLYAHLRDGAAVLQDKNGSSKGGNTFSFPLRPPFWDALEDCNNILIAGCGGGYDFFSGLPLFLALQKWVSVYTMFLIDHSIIHLNNRVRNRARKFISQTLPSQTASNMSPDASSRSIVLK